MNEISNLSNVIKTEKFTKIIPENIKLGVNVYDVTGTFEGNSGVKQFDSIANMQADPSPSDGDLATIYTNNQAGVTADSEFQIATFPGTVALSEVLSDYVDIGFQAVDQSIMFDCMGMLDSQRFDMECYTDNGDIRIQYESQDGINYIRTRFMKNDQEVSGNVMDFDTVIKYGSRWGGGEFNSVLSNFILVGSAEYSGLYKYNSGDNRYELAPTSLSTTQETVYEGKFYGKNGVQEGNLSNINNLSIQEVRNRTNLYSNLSYLELNENITNLSNVFRYKNNLTVVPNINTNKVTDMTETFFDCQNLALVPNFDTSNVINMSGMLGQCYNLKEIPNFDTSNVTNISRLIMYCVNLFTVPNFNTSNVTNMCGMFQGCYNLTTSPNFDTSNVVNMQSMFQYCNNLTTVPDFDTSNVTCMSYMFERCTNLVNVPNFDTSNVNNITEMFLGCSNLTTISNFNTSNVTYMPRMFSDCVNLTTVPDFDTSNVIEMTRMFYNCVNLTMIPNFNTSRVNYMSEMFCNCYNLTAVPNLDISNVYNVSYMFANCQSLTSVPMMNFNKISSDYVMTNMFKSCNNLSAESLANIANSLPKLSYSGYLNTLGLTPDAFTEEQCRILASKGYEDAIPLAINTAKSSAYWNIYYE